MSKMILSILAIGLLYVVTVMSFGFEGPIALIINFGRVSLAVAVLFIYLPTLGVIFKQVPAPSRDYLLAGIILTWLSGFLFAVSNEAGRIFNYDTSIFTNPVAGFFSFLLVAGAVFHIVAPDNQDGRERRRFMALVVGGIVGFLVVFIAPLFRDLT